MHINILILFFGYALFLPSWLTADDWNQWRGNHRDGVWTESGIIDSFTPADVKPLWTKSIGSGYSSPTVADGRVFVMDYSKEKSEESIRCFDALTGKPIWTHSYATDYRISYDAGPRSAVTLDEKIAYSFGAMGQLICLNADDGKVIWERDLNEDYQIVASKRMPIWGMSCSPLIWKDNLILQVGAKQAGIVALNKSTGKEIWRSTTDRGHYSSPVLTKQNGKSVVVCWTGDAIVGLNPDNGIAYWRYLLPPSRMPIGVATPIIQQNRIFVTSFYDGSALIEMTDNMGIREVWRKVGPNERRTQGLHSIISTPIWLDECIYGVDSYGELRCLDASNGQRLWEDKSIVPTQRWGTVHFVKNDDNIWMFNEVGELMVGSLTPKGMQIDSRVKVLEPDQMRSRNRQDGVCWSHPAFANQCVYLRNDSKLVCINLAKKD
ncbi:MAG: PQQ-binding-like beta-propeller repeat protein [Planctomycetota bacterium]